MSSQMQQARDVFANAGINASGDKAETIEPIEKVIEDERQEEVQDETVPKEQDVEPQEVKEEIAQDPEPEAAESYTPDTLAEAIGFETGELYEILKIPMKDGQDPVSLGDIKTQFTDMHRENDTLKGQLTDMQGQLEMAKSGGPVGINNEIAQAQAYIQQLQASMNTEEMRELKDIDPTRYLIESGDVKDNIEKTHIYINQLNQKQQIDNKTMLDGYNLKYVELIPSWSDGAVKASDQAIMKGYMQSRGWSDAEINQMADPRIQVIVKELIDLRAEKSSATDAVKQVRKAPKMISNTRKAPKVDKSNTTQKLVNKARTTRGKGDVLAAARAVMGKQG